MRTLYVTLNGPQFSDMRFWPLLVQNYHCEMLFLWDIASMSKIQTLKTSGTKIRKFNVVKIVRLLEIIHFWDQNFGFWWFSDSQNCQNQHFWHFQRAEFAIWNYFVKPNLQVWTKLDHKNCETDCLGLVHCTIFILIEVWS